MPDGFESLKRAELKLQKELAGTNIDALTLSPEKVVSLAKIADQQRQLERELLTNDGFQDALSSVLQQERKIDETFQNIDFSAINTSAIESIATNEFVIESTEAAEAELSDEVNIDDGISDEEAQELIRWSGFIAAAATAKDSAPSLDENETTILTFTIFVMILVGMGFSGIGPIVGANALANMLSTILSAAGLWDEEDS